MPASCARVCPRPIPRRLTLKTFWARSKTTRGRREHSNVDDEGEDESPRPASTPAEGAMKEEVLDAADPALDDPRDAGPPSSRPSDERGRNGGAGESDDQNTRRDVTAAAGRPTIGASLQVRS